MEVPRLNGAHVSSVLTLALEVRVYCPLEDAEVRKGPTPARDHTVNEQQSWVWSSNASENSLCFVTCHTWIDRSVPSWGDSRHWEGKKRLWEMGEGVPSGRGHQRPLSYP